MKHIAVRLLEATPSSAVAQLERPVKDSSEDQAFTAVNSDKREVDVILIIEGPGNEFDKHYYSAEAIQDGVKKFEGARAFLNHQTEAEQESRPEQDVKELCGFYKNTRLVPQVFNAKLGKMVTGLGATFVPTATEAGNTAFALAKAQVLWKQTFPQRTDDCFAALSINSGGMADEDPLEFNGEDWIKVTSFEDVRSVDVVTRPGAGGAFVRLTESVAGVPVTNQGEAMKKKLQEAVKLLEKATAAVKAEKDAKKKAALEAEREKAQLALTKLLEAEMKKDEEEEDEAGSHKEGEEDEEEDEDGEEDPLAALKGHVPQSEGENDQQYADRLAAIMGHSAKGAKAEKAAAKENEDEDEGGKKEKKEAKRHRESGLVRKFRTEQPRLFAEIMEGARATLNVERMDIKGLKETIKKQERELNGLRLERDLGICENMLKEAGIPAKYCSAGRLLKMEESDRKEEIARLLLIMEGAGVTRVFDGPGGGMHESRSGNEDFVGLDSLGTKSDDEEDGK